MPPLADNSAQIPHNQSGHDLFFMVHKLLDLVVQKFETEYVIHQDCTIEISAVVQVPPLADNSAQIPHNQSGHDLFFMVHKLLDLVVQKFETEYVIHQDCTIDEAMMKL